MKTILFSIVLLLSVNAQAAELTDADAAKKAARMEQLVSKSQERLNSLIKLNGRSQYDTIVRAPLQAELDAWPKQHQDNRAIFPYYACQQAAASLIQYGDGWKHEDKTKAWRDHVIKTFRADQQACKDSIAKPDLSLKNVM